MNKVEAEKITQEWFKEYDGLQISGFEGEVQYSRGYLEAIEKGEKLAEALRKIAQLRGVDISWPMHRNKKAVVEIAKEAIEEWEKNK